MKSKNQIKIVATLIVVAFFIFIPFYAYAIDGGGNTGGQSGGSGASYTPGQGASIDTGTGSTGGMQGTTTGQWAITQNGGRYTRAVYYVEYNGTMYQSNHVDTSIEWIDGTMDYRNSEWEIHNLILTGMSGSVKENMIRDGFTVHVYVEIWARQPGGSYNWWNIRNNFNTLTQKPGGGSTWIANRVIMAGDNLGAIGRGWASYGVEASLPEESLEITNINIDSWQGRPNGHPQQGRGAWEIQPLFGVDAHRTVTAGTGFEINITTRYIGEHADSVAAGNLLSVSTNFHQAGQTTLQPTSITKTNDYEVVTLWRLPQHSHQGESGTTYTARTHLISESFQDMWP